MSPSPTLVAPHGPRPWLYFFAGCAVLPLACVAVIGCLALAGIANAAAWSRGASAPPVEAQTVGDPDTLRAEWEALPSGQAAAGEQVFAGAGSCQACHSLEPGKQIVGPSLAGIAERAAAAAPGFSAELYLYESIVAPDAHVVPGFHAGVMPGNFRQRLDDQQLADLVAFLLTR